MGGDGCERAARLAELELREAELLGELRHRVTNAIATARAISRLLLARETDAARYQSRLAERLDAFARTHDLLLEAGWSSVPLADLVRSEAGAREGAAGRIRVTGDPVALAPGEATAFGMALHELISNACAHGALSNDRGEVEVGARARLACGGNLIRWEERGGPAVDAAPGRGFGRLVLERVLATNLDAPVRLDFRPEGVVMEVAYAPAPAR